MSRSVTIPHQRVMFGPSRDGTVRGVLVASPDGGAHGHLSVATQDGAHRYRAVSGFAAENPVLSIQLEEIRTDPGTIGLASLDVHVTDFAPGSDGPTDAEIILSSLPDGAEIMRAAVQLEVRDEPQSAPATAGS